MPERYQFPLNDTDLYNAKVIFQVRIEEPPSISFNGHASRVEPQEDVGVVDAIKTVFSGTTYTSNTVTRLGDKCSLYMPSGLTFQDGVVYERADLGRIGGGVEQGVMRGESIVKNAIDSTVSSYTELFNKSLGPDAARMVAVRAAKYAGADIGAGVQSALRVATNPNTRQLFKEVNLRDFAFSFRLVPVSKEEAEMAKAIIKFFRTELYPEDSVNIDVGGGAVIPIGYRFPNSFDISFKHRDKNIIHRLLPCYLAAISTSYNPGTMGFFEDGNFTDIQVDLSFRESRTLTKKLVQEGY